MRPLITSIASALVVAVMAIVAASPVAANERGVVYDGDDPGPGYTPLEALGLFVGIPVLTIVIIVLAVYAPGWARGRGGASTEESASREPLWLSSPAGTMAAPSGPGMITASGPTDHEERGGASARW